MVGAGTMGAGIAQVAALGGFEVSLHDPLPDALARGSERLRAALAKGAGKGMWDAADAEAAAERVTTCESLEQLGGCELVVEAAPEDLGLKRELFARLAEACGRDAVLATNTSSLSVTAIAAGVPQPARVVGMHFFNPPALMRLVEVVAGEESGEDALALAEDAARRMGRVPVRAADEIGFIANRCARPFGLEGVRLLGERLAAHDEIDRICRLGGGFRMGPFELMDLVGIDVNFEVAKSFWEQSFGEPRWRPHPIQARMAAAGRHGRKSGRGYYDYSGGPHRPQDPPAPEPGGEGRLAIAGEGRLADDLRELARAAGYEVVAPGAEAAEPAAILVASPQPAVDEDADVGALPLVAAAAPEATAPPVSLLLADGSLAALDPGIGATGFHALAPLRRGGLVELARSADTRDDDAGAVERLFSSLGLHVAWVADAPGLVLGRIVCQLVNEAAFALAAGIGRAEDIDTAMRLGFNYPRGPLEWADEIGLDHVLAVLDALHAELGEERYRAAPLLRRLVAEGRLGAPTGAGFRLG